MSLVFLLAFRNLASRKSRTLLTTLGVAIGIATAVGVFILDHNTLLTIKIQELSRYGEPDLEISPVVTDMASFDAASMALQEKAYIRRTTPLFFTTQFLSLPDRQEGIEIAGLEPDARGWFGGYSTVRGGENLPDSGYVILLNEGFSQDTGVVVGDTVRFAVRPDIPFRVIGLLRNWKLGTRNNGAFGVIPFRDGWKAFQDYTLSPFFWVKTDGTPVDYIRADLGLRYLVTLPAHVLAGETGDEKVMRDGVRVSGILTLFLGLYLVFTSLSMAVAERIREIGLMQAIGTTDRQIAAVYILEAGIMAGVGALIGLVGGIVVTWGLMKLGFSSLGTGMWVWTFRLPGQRIRYILLMGVGAAMVGALYPLLKASRIPVIEALKQRGVRLEIVLSRRLYGLFILAFTVLVPAGYFLLAGLIGFPWRPALPIVFGATLLFSAFFSVIFLGQSLVSALIRLISWPVNRTALCEGFLVERALSRATDRISAALLTLAVVFAGVIGLKHMTESLKIQSRDWVDHALTDRVFILARQLKTADYERFIDVPGVRGVTPMSHTMPMPFLIRGVPVESFLSGPLSRDPAFLSAFTDSPALVISTQLAQNMGFSPGDSLTLNGVSGPVVFTILAISDEYGYFLDDRAYGVMALSRLQALAPQDTSVSNKFTLTLAEGTDETQVMNELYARFGALGLQITTGAQKKAWTLGGIDKDFLIFEIILAITAVLAGIGVTNALLIGALERRREFGLLQALGITPAQLSRIVILEGTVIGMVGGILGALLGIPLSWIIIEALKMVSRLDLMFVLSPLWIGVSILAAMMVSTLAGLYPAMKTVRTPVTESLQYE